MGRRVPDALVMHSTFERVKQTCAAQPTSRNAIEDRLWTTPNFFFSISGGAQTIFERVAETLRERVCGC